MEQAPNMQNYQKEYRDFSLPVPEYFSFPLDVFDRWRNRTALFWTDGVLDIKLTFDELRLQLVEDRRRIPGEGGLKRRQGARNAPQCP